MLINFHNRFFGLSEQGTKKHQTVDGQPFMVNGATYCYYQGYKTYTKGDFSLKAIIINLALHYHQPSTINRAPFTVHHFPIFGPK